MGRARRPPGPRPGIAGRRTARSSHHWAIVVPAVDSRNWAFAAGPWQSGGVVGLPPGGWGRATARPSRPPAGPWRPYRRRSASEGGALLEAGRGPPRPAAAEAGAGPRRRRALAEATAGGPVPRPAAGPRQRPRVAAEDRGRGWPAETRGPRWAADTRGRQGGGARQWRGPRPDGWPPPSMTSWRSWETTGSRAGGPDLRHGPADRRPAGGGASSAARPRSCPQVWAKVSFGGPCPVRLVDQGRRPFQAGKIAGSKPARGTPFLKHIGGGG